MPPAAVDLGDAPVIDGHGHPLLAEGAELSPERFAALFSEGRPGAMAAHLPHTGYFRRTLVALARELGTPPTPEAVLEARRRRDPAAAGRALADAGVAALLVDTGYPPSAMPLATMRQRLPCPVHEVVRIETRAEALLPAALPFADFLAALGAELRAAAERCVAFKSIVAYRSGLAVRPAAGEAAAAYRRAVARVRAGGSPRLVDKPLLDALFALGLDVAAATGRPLQVHAGFGDPDIDLPTANPALLRPVLEDPRRAGVRLVVLHMAYPYVREAAFLAAVYPHVYVDCSLALPYLGPGAVPPLVELLSLAPWTKLLYGSDVSALPELFALAARGGRAALGEALGWLAARDGLGDAAPEAIGRRILADNARTLYQLAARGAAAGVTGS
jgi:predicted TIM-barrel fold metal-dependent hydrolase